MRALGLFNLTYGTTGLTSSVWLDRADGSLLSLWVMGVGAIAFLGIMPSRVLLRRTLARLSALSGR